ncbi:hypothetical protein [Muricoccus radiodurans]|uniref:hypothetical protein n=1 Tax=Muricoccus radiodurans TaxID=2231721 RepID=UPI003CF6FC0F
MDPHGLLALVRWDLAASLPHGPTDDPTIRSLRAYRAGDAADLLVCLTLTFDEPETAAVLRYGLDRTGSLRLAGAPFFHGLDWLHGSGPPADACEAARTGTARRGAERVR